MSCNWAVCHGFALSLQVQTTLHKQNVLIDYFIPFFCCWISFQYLIWWDVCLYFDYRLDRLIRLISLTSQYLRVRLPSLLLRITWNLMRMCCVWNLLSSQAPIKSKYDICGNPVNSVKKIFFKTDTWLCAPWLCFKSNLSNYNKRFSALYPSSAFIKLHNSA